MPLINPNGGNVMAIKPNDDMGGSIDMRQLTDRVVEAAKSSKKVNKISSSLTQLNLANMHLHGRDDDMKLLKSKLREFAKVDNKDGSDDADAARRLELLLVSGVSGTGKSALVKRGLEEPARKMGLAFVGGKFDLNNAALPLSAFSTAMTSLTQFIMASKNNKDKIKDGIKEVLSDNKDISNLLDVMPGCEDLFTIEGTKSNHFVTKDRRPSFGGKEAVNRLQYAIRRLLKVICSNLKGVVLFIDDLQWSDVATIQLLKEIAKDKDIPSILLVGAYREDEVSDSHPLMLQIRDSEANGVETTTIKIGNLSLNHTNSLVAEALRMEDNEDAVSTVAGTIHKKTDGNAFFVLVFLKSLYDEELLQYSFGAMKWIWDDDAVNSKLVTENVATILINKLKRFNESSQMALQVASCLGASFSTTTVAMVMGGLSTSESEITSSLPSSMIQELEDEGLWEKERDSTTQRRFSHDQIQSAAFEIIQPETRDSFRGKIGDILMQKLSPDDLEGHLFEVVSLRNCDKASTSGQDRQELAKMNLRAGLKASGNAAFDAAVVYYHTGRQLLGETGWDDDGDTMLNLCSQEAKACSINGDVTTMSQLIDEVLSKDISIEDKFQAYETKILAAQSHANFLEAIDICIEVRSQLGLRTPANKPTSKFIVLKEYFKTSRVLSNRTPEELATLAKLKKKKIIQGQRMLELLITSTFMAQPTLYPLIVFLMVRATIKHGINASSCEAFAGYGLLLGAVFGKFNRGRDMAKAAELLLENPEYQRMQPRMTFMCEALIYHWTAPLQGTLTPLLAGYQKGLEIGDVENASDCLMHRSYFLWYSSRPLDGAVHELQTNVDVLVSHLKQQNFGLITLGYLLAAKKLRGIDDDGLDFDSVLASQNAKNSIAGTAFTITTQIEVCVLFQDIDTALNLLEGAGNVRALAPGTFASVRFTVLESLVYLKAAQASKSWQVKKKLTKKAIKPMKLIRGWLKSGSVNLVHAMHLLSAEHAVLKGNESTAEEQFKLAISVASTNGFLQDRGLAHELAGRYYATRGDTYWAGYHLERAELSFTDWGATAKVEQLRETKMVLLGDD